jgi:hypothetical protein
VSNYLVDYRGVLYFLARFSSSSCNSSSNSSRYETKNVIGTENKEDEHWFRILN